MIGLENAEDGSLGIDGLVMSLLLVVSPSSIANPLMMGCWITLLVLEAMDWVELFSCSLMLGMELVVLLLSSLLLVLPYSSAKEDLDDNRARALPLFFLVLPLLELLVLVWSGW